MVNLAGQIKNVKYFFSVSHSSKLRFFAFVGQFSPPYQSLASVHDSTTKHAYILVA